MRFLNWLMFWKRRKSFQQDVGKASHWLVDYADRKDAELEEYKRSGKSHG